MSNPQPPAPPPWSDCPQCRQEEDQAKDDYREWHPSPCCPTCAAHAAWVQTLKADRDRLRAALAQLAGVILGGPGANYQTHDCPISMGLKCRICEAADAARAALGESS